MCGAVDNNFERGNARELPDNSRPALESLRAPPPRQWRIKPAARFVVTPFFPFSLSRLLRFSMFSSFLFCFAT